MTTLDAPLRAPSRPITAPAITLVIGLVLLATLAGCGVFVGASFLSPADVVASLRHESAAATVAVIDGMRIPRTLLGMVVGAALGLAGALMQALTRNPLADPGLLGVNAGAGLAVVIGVAAFGATAFVQQIGLALVGALVVSVAVYAIGFSGRATPATLVLTGTAFSAVCLGITNGLSLVDPADFNVLRGWSSGSLANRDIATVGLTAALVLVSAVLAVFVAAPLGQLALGDDLARGLGVNVTGVRIAAAAAITLLAGVATAAAGPIVFVGLMVPQLARVVSGPRIGWILALSAVGGADLTLLADVVGRLVIWPAEAPAGLITAIIGTPVLVMIARGRRVTA
ncbi:iron ABC transporter permease [Curtobacterium sp. 18060]|uniref:FecCD family ABC transporter permease n=1 Tax=Curtobacterium sp. 18060 TaxID=2681408 RepID=UPI0013582E43|nr:iron ABC transporter permease [Curtobacterium sp. 18060]